MLIRLLKIASVDEEMSSSVPTILDNSEAVECDCLSFN